jgi:uncharacterized protein YndB with AHSA1/START domain
LLLDSLRARNGQALRELCLQLEMTRPAVSKHLAVLEKARLVVVLRRGREKRHYLNPAPIADIAERWISKYERHRLDALAELKRELENEPMSEPAFVYETEIKTTPERVWAALTSGQLTRQYWFDRRIESDWAVGSKVVFYDGESDTVTDTGEVLECDPPRRLVYSFRQEIEGEGALPDKPSTRVAFDITPVGDRRVELRLVHDQLASPEHVEGWRQGWTPILTNLQKFLESSGSEKDAG